MIMEEYQKRVIEEKEELASKLIKLEDYLENPIGATIVQLGFLKVQYSCMRSYYDVLNLRINDFNRDDNI